MALAPSSVIRPPSNLAWCATSTALATTPGSTSVTAPTAWTSAWRVSGGWYGYWGGMWLPRGERGGWLTDTLLLAIAGCRWRSTWC